MKIGLCPNFTCRHKNESETAICSREDCPLMTEKSPFTYPFNKKHEEKEPKEK